VLLQKRNEEEENEEEEGRQKWVNDDCKLQYFGITPTTLGSRETIVEGILVHCCSRKPTKTNAETLAKLEKKWRARWVAFSRNP
jgi:hypothetical protein